MFTNLIESKPQKTKSLGGTIASIAIHAILITLAVLGLNILARTIFTNK